MLPTIKAEFRKLLTVRSTYILVGLSLVLVIFYAFFFEGYKGNTGSSAAKLAPTAMQEIIANAAGLGVTLVTIIAILFMAHEYRYNTIMYTLTANARRTRVLLAKVVASAIFSAGVGLLIVSVALGGYLFGLSLRGASLPPQDFPALVEIGKVAFYYLGYALIGLLLAALVRNIVAAVAGLLILSTTIEPLLAEFVLKANAKYLPFTALDTSVGATMMQNPLSTGVAMGVAGAYLLAGLLATWFLFVRRDAN